MSKRLGMFVFGFAAAGMLFFLGRAWREQRQSEDFDDLADRLQGSLESLEQRSPGA